MKLLLDTDIGSDIDDAVCLSYLLAQPECDLLGITTVSGDTVARAKLASALCRVAGRAIPIYPGASNPLIIEQRQKEVPQAQALANWPHDSYYPKLEAIQFLRRTIRENPGEVTLLTIGPLTNIALLFLIDPEIPQLLDGLVMMIGKFLEYDARGEWNAWLDPHAASIVYRTDVKTHRSIGLDVTLQCIMTDVEVKKKFEHPLLRPVVDFAGAWFAHSSQITFHDPLAAVTLFDSHVCGYERGTVAVAPVIGDPTSTVFTKESDGPHQIATTVDVDRFFKSYFQVFGI